MAPHAGNEVGRYRLDEMIGAGGFATVWAAHHIDSGDPVAVKILHNNYLDEEDDGGPSVADRFLEEARLLASIDDPGFVRVRELIDARQSGRPEVALVMERLQGQDLSHAADDLDLPEILDVFADVAEILGRLHPLGILHRDVKPSNIFLA